MRVGAGYSAETYDKFALRVVLICSMAGVFMQALDSTIANVALPYMQGSLSASRDQVTWVLTSYIVAAAIMTAPVGWLASRFGKKNVAVVSLAGFTIASMLCGAAQSLTEIVIFRLLQGMFGAALSPLSQAIMLDLYPPSKRGSIMAIWGMGVMLGPILGPTLGGYLTDMYSWRWVFYVNVPFGIAAVTGIALFFKDSARDETMRFDWFGFSLLALGLGALQLMLDRGTSKSWFDSGEIIIEAVLAGLCLYLFLVQMITAKEPFIPRALFLDRNLVSSLLLMFITGAILVASSALLPPYLQDLGGYSVFDSGLLMVPRGFGTMIAMMFAGRMALRIEPRLLIGGGIVLLIWSMWEMSGWLPSINTWDLIIVTFIQGIGMGFVFVPMNLIAFASLDQRLRTDGTAILSLMRNVGSAIGISTTTYVLTSTMQISHADLAAHVTPFNRALGVNAQSLFWNPQLPFGLAQIDGVIQQNAAAIAYSNDFLFMFFISIPAIFVVMFMRKVDLSPDMAAEVVE
ncbi:MAG: DHA2 family efflux MFS transporter permease subunit [Alphaproteobacteria bacterium]|jgi:DHA2 family multidrug resistance protein|nr:DHA2 family efflux MFS transporter permease subunit [Alphaproteobacteria bacterium]